MIETTEKKTLYDRIDERTPKLPFDDAKEGFRQLVADIGKFYRKHKGDKPQGIIMRTLSMMQILILVGALVGLIYCILWILTHLLPW